MVYEYIDLDKDVWIGYVIGLFVYVFDGIVDLGVSFEVEFCV